MPGSIRALVGYSTSRKSDILPFKLPFAEQGDSVVTVKLIKYGCTQRMHGLE